MKSTFKEFYFDNKNSDIWINSVVILDANVLLNLYRYSKETSRKLLSLLKKSQERLWLPHQIALEFHLNRTNVILDQQTSYEKIESILSKKSSEIETSLKKELASYRKKHVTLSIDSIIDQVKEAINTLILEIKQEKEDHPQLLRNDHIKFDITEIFENKVGKPYGKKRLDELAKEAEQRYKLEIPPGYEDASKKGAKFYNGEIILEKYGDYILWKQIIDFAKEKQTNIIFITDDEKDDWWYKSKGKTIGPRSELLNEFNFITGKEFYMFKPEIFMKEAGDIYSENFSDNTISEVKEISKESADYSFYSRHGKSIEPMNTKDHLNEYYYGEAVSSINSIISILHNRFLYNSDIDEVFQTFSFNKEFSYYTISSNTPHKKQSEYKFETKISLRVYMSEWDSIGEMLNYRILKHFVSRMPDCLINIID
ncbi:PIN-like domain-containing protein [Bacillus sp. G16]|uniref:PIN-like domain-containing protein n=1 Tax=Bacillus sp. G16 TaxID=667304 RepID=UPI001E4337C6|nr:PIN-like domain-containing protein [Bacillus sp. G16]MCE0742241.1 PIN domain-containing protein [Bacillus sp. G16]